MAMFAQIAGQALQTVGGVTTGLADASKTDEQAASAQYNANVDSIEAQNAYAQGVSKEEFTRRQAAQQLGAQRAAVAESGFNPNTGSALDVQAQSASNAELDALQTRYEGILQGNKFEQQQTIDQYQANALKATARSQKIGAYLSIAGKALSTASSAYGGGSSGSPGSAGGASSFGSFGGGSSGGFSGGFDSAGTAFS